MVGALRGLRFARLPAVCGWWFARLAVCGGRFAVGVLQCAFGG